MRDKRQGIVWWTVEEKQRLEKLAETTRVPQAKIVRLAVAELTEADVIRLWEKSRERKRVTA